MRPDEQVLRRWFPEAVVVAPENWLPYAEVPGGVEVEVLFRQGEPVALVERHVRQDGSRCQGLVQLRPTEEDPDVWTVEQESPLTLSPSVACAACGHHGWFRDGRWVSA